MLVLSTLVVAFSMFSALPMPQIQWNEKNMRYSLCAFPAVGAVIGLLLWGWAALSGLLGLSALLRGAGLCLLPVFLTGGIHLDGFADTCDALASHAEPERRQEILKDPRLGAFAAIRLCAWFLTSFVLCVSLETDWRSLLCLGLGFVLSRAASGFAVASFPLAKNTGLAHTFASSADRKTVRIVLGLLSLLAAGGMTAAKWDAGLLMSAAAAAVFLWYRRMAQKKFGGLSGDLAGWFLQTAELAMLAALVLIQCLEGIL